jgi:protein SDA1
VSIVALGCFHPVMKVQSASIHFFLGSDEEKRDSGDEEEDVSAYAGCMAFLMCISQVPDVRALHHRREINKKTRSGDKKLQKILNAAKKVYINACFCTFADFFAEASQETRRFVS